MPLEKTAKIIYHEITSGKRSDNLAKLPVIKTGYDSYFIENKKPSKNFINKNKRGIARYLDVLPINEEPLTLGEGQTPLIPSKQFNNVYIKNEGMNPTGNFKDRESALALAFAKENNYKNLAITSSGNAALSAALYARIYDMRVTCYIPSRTPQHKTNIIDLFGARTHIVGDTYEESYHYLLDNIPARSINITSGAFPLRSEGAKTIAYEIWEDLGSVPDVIVCPAGNGSVLASIFHGFLELKTWGFTEKIPAMVSVQIKGGDPINQSFMQNKWLTVLKEVPDSESEAIVANESFCSPKAVYALRESKGICISVDDHQIIDGLRFAIDNEGIFPEFSSASVFSSMLEYGDQIEKLGKTIVLINSATGLKEAHSLRKALSRF